MNSLYFPFCSMLHKTASCCFRTRVEITYLKRKRLKDTILNHICKSLKRELFEFTLTVPLRAWSRFSNLSGLYLRAIASPSNSAQFLAIPQNFLQFRIIPWNSYNSSQFRTIPRNFTQFLEIPHNSSQFCRIPRNSAQFRSIPHNSSQFIAIPCNSAQFLAISHNSSNSSTIPRHRILIRDPSLKTLKTQGTHFKLD